jgi:hypothetical protein
LKPFNYRYKGVFLLPLMLLICLLVTACGGSIKGKIPSEIDMGSVNQSHDSHGGQGTAAENTVSCADMTEQPSSGPVRAFELKAAKTSLVLNNGKKAKHGPTMAPRPGPSCGFGKGIASS